VTVTAFIGRVLPAPNVRKNIITINKRVVIRTLAILLGIPGIMATAGSPVAAQTITREQAARAAIHPVANEAALRDWLRRVPKTRAFPPDFTATLRGQGSLYLIEMTTAPGCVPCADLWAALGVFHRAYGWQVRTISGQEALLRSGRLGLPWVGHPVAWVRPVTDPDRTIPIAIGTDHEINIARNAYLAAKMLTGVRADVGLRAMSKYTGIVGVVSTQGRAR
jgi:hypothetical protein